MLLKSFWNLQYYIIFIIFYQCSKFFRTISWSLHTPPVWERVVRDPTFLVTYKTSEPCTSRCTFEVKRGLIPKDSVTPLTLHHVSLVQSNITPAQNMQSSRRLHKSSHNVLHLSYGAQLCTHSRSIAGTPIYHPSLSPVSPPLSRRQGA